MRAVKGELQHPMAVLSLTRSRRSIYRITITGNASVVARPFAVRGLPGTFLTIQLSLRGYVLSCECSGFRRRLR